MNLLKLLLRYCFLFAYTSVLAQTTTQPMPLCGTDELHQHTLRQNSLYSKQHQHFDETVFHRTQDKTLRTSSSDPHTVPVVIHIIHNNGTENISDAQVYAALQHMNDAFNNVGPYYNTSGTATGIQFCLAKQDENGNATTGITRHQSALTNLSAPSQDIALKNIVRWDPTQYLNIWIVSEITSESAGAGVAGYAFFPSSHGSTADGIVCEALYFGTNTNASKVLIHELGHYFGLYHTFEGGCDNNNCLLNGDRVCDTPPDASSAPVLCPSTINSCSSDDDDLSTNNPFRPVSAGGLGDQPDMTTNYMDYGMEDCHILFTDGQKERMINSLTGLRASLLESGACNDPCTNPAQIAFTPSDTTVQLGATVQFYNSTSGATTYEWQIEGATFSSATHPAYLFNQQGTYTITLITPSTEEGCTRKDSIDIKVICNISATFTGPTSIKPGEPVIFTNTTTGASSYEWFINGTSVSTAQHLTHTFGVGGFSVNMVAYNGKCYDTSRTIFVESATCNLSNKSKIWHFGGWAGLDFSGDTAVYISYPITFPVIFHRGEEGCVSMSDNNGNHLFFANPGYVFNKNREVMPNGSGLLGDASATQMAAVQNPANSNRYYLFTLDAFGNPNGLRYSEIDMTLNGGLGDVIIATKNTPMLTPVTEKISTVKHSNGIDTWVLVHQMNTDVFYAYLVTATGIEAPVMSTIGSVHGGIGLGQLKFSPDGCKIAVAMWEENMVEIFNFDNTTGLLSSPISLSAPDMAGAYGLEFSPDGSKLYVGTEMTKFIYQFDMHKTTEADIMASRVLVGSAMSPYGLGAFQLGPYGKIYIARTGAFYLATIENPNAPGLLCTVVKESVFLGDRMSSNGLPCFPQEYFYDPTPVITGPDTICANSTDISYIISGSTCTSGNVTWTLHGGATITASNDTSATIDFGSTSQIDTLIVHRTSSCGITVDTLLITVTDTFIDIPDTLMCSAHPILLDAGAGYASYLWQDNSILQTYSATAPGTYWVEVSTPTGCLSTDTIHVLDPGVDFDLGPDLAKCPGGLIVLDAGEGYTAYEWQDHTNNQTFTAYLPGTYWVTVTNACNNEDTDSVTITLSMTLPIDLGDDKEICPGDVLTLQANGSYQSYIWSDHSPASTLTVTEEGTYWLIVTDYAGCYGYDSIQVISGASCCDEVNIPTLITPNHDGLNETFEISCINNRGWTLEVYNRWGQAVYKKEGYANHWNAEGVSDGVYYYVLKRNEDVRKGWVQVVR